MRKWIVIGLAMSVIATVGVSVSRWSQPKPGTLEFHKNKYSSAYHQIHGQRNLWESIVSGARYAYYSRIYGDGQRAFVASKAPVVAAFDEHQRALLTLGYFQQKTFGVPTSRLRDVQKDVAWKAGFALPRNELFTISRSSTTNELIVVCRPKHMDSFERWIKDSQEWRQAAQPQTQVEMHRAKATTKDPSGWYLAASTHGNFSVLIPVPFHDATGAHGTVTAQMVAAKTTEGIKFCASETPIIPGSGYTNLASFPERFLKPDHTVSDIDTSPFAGYPSVSFSVKGPSNGKIMRFVETPKSLIVVILEYPNEQAKAAEGFRSTFLSSLKINKTESEAPEVNASSKSP